ncbi:peptidase C26 family protein [Natronomonas pharaonis DSM 2160]|uniref:Peptidase C26 family protein n=1 Tax=Natronomonas pharaonis (strain ATCC 35678 / DSM 2160 / CIP 103997 / JCM 8858 / NBRC 14720 / NCIMB 2260 / Gabara) TaxID=348780 RepID=A0A1U7EVK1_NATPD|nr:type 1 glutamine amidotransferase [Natronomonas pharaonis]CAI49066.1 peptidase C26 family protein [Natronomonas pharaonis DSM 2160]
MRRLGVTQRVEVVEEYGERRDCLDQAWTELLESWEFRPFPLPNTVENVETYLDSLNLDGIVLTSGNDLSNLKNPDDPAPERDRFERAALEWAIDHKVPVCGVCRGLELLNDHFDGSLSPVSGHVAVDHGVSFGYEAIDFSEDADTVQLPSEIKTNSYHDYGIDPSGVADPLSVLGTAADGTVEALHHPELPVLGIMWHPERDPDRPESSRALDRKLFDALFGESGQ